MTAGDGPVLRDASAAISVANDALRFDLITARLGTGTVSGRFTLDVAADPPSLSVEAKANDMIVTGPLTGAPIDLVSGRVNAGVRLDARGFSASAIVATLGGRVDVSVNDGVVSGFDLFRLKLAGESADPKTTEAMALDALHSGATAFDHIELAANIAQGDLALDAATLTGIAGKAHISGGMNLATQVLDVRIGLKPALPTPPEVTLHLVGRIDRPSRTDELAGLARWMAELVH